jgi:diaminopimelate decarboxylase
MKRSSFSRLVAGVLRLAREREQSLPPRVVETSIRDLLARKEVLLESARLLGTPQYFFDEPALSSGLDRFHQAFSEHLQHSRLFYAVKSNSYSGIAKHVIEKGHGLDVSSGYELSMALDLGCERIVFSGPGKTEGELRLAATNHDKVTVLLDSGRELERLAGLLREMVSLKGPVNVGFRTRGVLHGIWGKKFGVPLDEVAALFRKALSTPGLEPGGIQFHTSWNMAPDAQIRMIKMIGSTVRKGFPEDTWRFLKFLDIGGGYWPESGEWLNPENTLKGKLVQLFHPEYEFGMKHYRRPSKPIGHFAREISTALMQEGKPLSDIEIWTEPGRWISTPAMHILLKVVDKKDGDVVITDGGINLLGWERPLSEFIPVINLTRPSLKERPLRVFGSLCTPLDIWGTSIFGETAYPGDILLVPNQGAYTYSLRQSFIKPIARVIHYNGSSLREVEPETGHSAAGQR